MADMQSGVDQTLRDQNINPADIEDGDRRDLTSKVG